MRPETIRAALAIGIGAFLALFLSCREIPSRRDRTLAAYPSDLRGVPDLLVAVSRNVDGVRVSVTGRFTLRGASGREIPIRNESLAPVRVRASGGGLAVGEVQLRHTMLEFRPSPGEEVWLEGVPLPGSAVLAREGDGSLVAASVLLDVERFTCATLACRARWRHWSDETLAAHAVCLRTLALYRRTLARSAGAPWDFEQTDLTASLRDGAHRSPRVAKAVNRTRGIVLTWDRRLFPSFLTSSCGGRTEDASCVFTTSPIMPLSGVRCPFCSRIEHPNAEWTAKLSNARITDRLRPYVEREGRRLGSVRRLEPLVTGSSGRVARLRVATAFGPLDVDASTFQAAVGQETLPSALFVIKDVGPDLVEFVGRGEGQGVGMCQYGAERMSREGHVWHEIVRYYFPGAELARLPYRGRDLADGVAAGGAW